MALNQESWIMIAKQIKGKDFYGILAYNEQKVEKDQGYLLDTNITHDTTVNMTREFNMVRQLRPRLKKAVYHVSLSLPQGENLTDSEFKTMAYDYLQGMGFDDNQFITYRHTDTQQEHIHIITNRVKYSGDLVSDSRDYKRSEKLVRKLEVKYGLSTLPSSKLVKKTTITHKEIEKAIRTGKAPVKLVLQQRLDGAMLVCSDIQSFVRELNKKEVSPMFNASATTGRVTGVSFKYRGIVYKGSTLGRQYSWNNIIKQLDYDKERDCSIILENSRSNRTDTGLTGTIEDESKRAVGTASGTVEWYENAHEKSGHHMGKNQAIGWIAPLVDEDPWNPFKLELYDYNKKTKKRRRKRKKG
ncbi:MAG: relaxase/mobilization nuclease domain-containing protein [Bacteroidota bacterium]